MRDTENATLTQFNREALLEQARQRAGLSDFGDLWFLEPMDQFIAAANTESRLSPSGIAIQSETIVRGLVNRLRMIDDINSHPEILDEKVQVAAVILGLPRTGSTIFQRLLASAPGMTAIRWYEAQNFAPFPGELKGQPTERRATAQMIIDGWLKASPDLSSIHPLDPDAPDEEILILGQMFVSTMVEGTVFVPSFARWLDSYDQSRGHEDLKTILKYLQWQVPERKGSRWILKSPSNLPYAEVAANAFPEALLVMTHRDPLEIVPSFVSMEAAIYKLTSELPDEQVGRFWFERLLQWIARFEEARPRIGEDRFIDLSYLDVIKNPTKQALNVLEKVGIKIDGKIQHILDEFLEGNKREQRPFHEYSPEKFAISPENIAKSFEKYSKLYIN